MDQKDRRQATVVTFRVTVHAEDDGSYWSEVDELPGCFASGFSIEEVQEATEEAIQLWLPDGIKLGPMTWDEVKTKPRPKKTSATTSTRRRSTPKRRRMLVSA